MITRIKNIFKTPSCNRLKNEFKRGLHDKSGIAAIEFALIAPIFIILYIGLAETSFAIGTDREVSHAASVAGDLTTQLDVVSQSELEDVLAAALTVMNLDPSDRGSVNIEIASYSKDSSGTVDRIGYATMGPAIPAGPTIDTLANGLNDQLLSDVSGVVIARVEYEYTPPITRFVNTVRLSETIFLKPRRSSNLLFDEAGTDSFSCTANTTNPVASATC